MLQRSTPYLLLNHGLGESLHHLESRSIGDQQSLLSLGRQRLHSFEPHLRRWTEIIGEPPPNTPLPIKPWSPLIRAYACDCIAFAMRREAEKCFDPQVAGLFETAVTRCITRGLPAFVSAPGQRGFARGAVIDHIVGYGSPLWKCPVEKLLKDPTALVGEAVVHTLNALSVDQIPVSQPLDEPSLRRLRLGLRDKRNDYLRVETASKIEGTYSRLGPEEQAAHLEFGRNRLAQLERHVAKWRATVAMSSPPNSPLILRPWSETVDCYAKDCVAFVFARNAAESFGPEVAGLLEPLVGRALADWRPPGLLPREERWFARIAVCRHLLGDPRAETGLSPHRRIDASDPARFLIGALTVASADYSAPDGFGKFYQYSLPLVNEWRRNHRLRTANVNAPAPCPLPTYEEMAAELSSPMPSVHAPSLQKGPPIEPSPG